MEIQEESDGTPYPYSSRPGSGSQEDDQKDPFGLPGQDHIYLENKLGGIMIIFHSPAN